MSELQLRLGADVVAALLPHRPPLLLVDGVERYASAPAPTITARRAISVNEPVFEGHFPGMMLWPGVYTIEGMGQTCQLLLTWLAISEGFARAGLSDADALATLRSLDGRARLKGAATTASAAALEAHLGPAETRIGVSAAVDVRFFEPVFAGDVLRYQATLTHARDAVRRFDVQASVEGAPVARGTMTASLLSERRRA